MTEAEGVDVEGPPVVRADGEAPAATVGPPGATGPRRPATDGWGRSLVALAALLPVAVVLALRYEGAPAERVVVGAGAVALAALTHNVAHEAGHAVAGAAVGFRTFGVVLGAGPVWGRLAVGRVPVELRGVLLGGVTRAATRHRALFRTRQVVSVLGGPLATAAVTVAAWSWAAAPGASAVLRLALVGLGIVLLVQNLWPRSVTTGGRREPTDGLLVARTVVLTSAEVDEEVAAFPAYQAAAGVPVTTRRGGGLHPGH